MYLVTVDTDLCEGCGECAKACPAQILKMSGDKAELVDDADCMGCESCIAVCPAGAIIIEEY